MKRLLLVVSGSAAIIKVPMLIKLLKADFEVKILTTDYAKKHFKNADLLQSESFDLDLEAYPTHIGLAKWADQIIVVPATANTMAKVAHCIADNEALACLLAARQKIVFVPAMNTYMYEAIKTAGILDMLAARGHMFIGPVVGKLKEGESGMGRMTEPVEIAQMLKNLVYSNKFKKAVVVSGASKVYIDPIRYITNGSTGIMGKLIVNELRLKGYEVTLLDASEYTNQDLVAKVNSMDFDLYISPAALADFDISKSETKIHKGEISVLDLKNNIDVLEAVRPKHPKAQFIAFKHDNDKANAWDKLKRLNLDAIVWNGIGSMGSSQIKGAILYANGKEEAFDFDKKSLAELICKEC